tara:strand:+ start:98 stop:262 length:165 start_codon:yes stop_codon:yes gene_type:complete
MCRPVIENVRYFLSDVSLQVAIWNGRIMGVTGSEFDTGRILLVEDNDTARDIRR